jgi:hypothetical protein
MSASREFVPPGDPRHSFHTGVAVSQPPLHPREVMMATALTDPNITLRDDAHRRVRRTLRLLQYRFVTTGWQRYQEQRMFRVLRTIDHPGVLEDARIACGPPRR